MTSKAEDVNKIMEYLIRGEDAPSYLAEDGIAWPCPDELLDNLFSLEDSSLGLLDQPLPDFPMEPTADLMGGGLDDLSYPDVTGSSCSDSGLSSDQADLTDYDQQLSPFLIHNPDRSSSPEPRSSPPRVEAVERQVPSAEPESLPNLDYVEEECISPGSPEGTVEVETTPPPKQKIVFRDTFQNPPNRKRRCSITPNMAIIQPKVHKPITTAPVTVTSKPHVILNSSPKPVKVANIQVINPMPRVFCKPNDSMGQRKVIRVAPMAGNPRSILLPVTIKDMKDLRGIKIINASDLKSSNIKFASNILSQTKLQEKLDRQNIQDEYDSNNSDESLSECSDEEDWPMKRAPPVQHNKKTPYPRLVLSAEERKLLAKEGIKLPASYPLTKHEERELKRIRRKIRNKISAQDSRKRKKEYVDGLEDRVKQCSEENQTLMKRIRILQSQNQSLTAQLKRLQSVLSGGGCKSAQPATCLLVLLMSVALVAVPSLRKDEPGQVQAGGVGAAEEGLALRRALLSATHKMSEEIVVDDGEFNMEELVTFKSHSDHDYPARKAGPPPGYLDIPIDDDWPPDRNKYKFDFDDGPDYLPLIKDENYENFREKPDFLKADSGGRYVLDTGGKLGSLGVISVKSEDIMKEERGERNSTVRSIVMNGTLA